MTFKLRVQPRASRTELAGEYGDALKLRITAPPVEGKANAECRRFLAKLLDVPASAVEIVAGASSKDKVIRVHNMDASRVREALRR